MPERFKSCATLADPLHLRATTGVPPFNEIEPVMLPDFDSHATQLQDPLELRATPRVAVDVPVDLYTADIRGALPGRARDISIEGACVATASPFAIKSLQKVVFSLEAGSLTLAATGAWQQDEEADDLVFTGLKFDTPQKEDLDRIWSLVFASGRTLARMGERL